MVGLANERSGFKCLGPAKLDDDTVSGYQEEFRFVFEDEHIRNVALSGPYGAGKSSVLNAWEEWAKKNGVCETPWIRISLASYTEDGFMGDSQAAGSEQESQNDLFGSVAGSRGKRNVESELLNQMLFKLGGRKLPKTRFRLTESSPRSRDFGRSVFLTVFALLCIFVVLGLEDCGYVWCPVWVYVAAACALACCVTRLVYEGLRAHTVGKILKRFKFLSAEVELFGDKDDPAFNRYLDDIVYLVANSDSSVIAFEDLDRFGDVSVFEKLHRVNELANYRREVLRADSKRKMWGKFGRQGNCEPVRFIYLIKDGLFCDPKDRTKFFDFIIPVIPFVNPSNSFDVLCRGLRDAGISVKHEEFLYQLSLYIDDPRVLKDICNESKHFKNVLIGATAKLSSWDDSHFIAMMAYKALFPRDYELLQVREGFVFSSLDLKAEIIGKALRDDERCLSAIDEQGVESTIAIGDDGESIDLYDALYEVERNLEKLPSLSLPDALRVYKGGAKRYFDEVCFKMGERESFSHKDSIVRSKYYSMLLFFLVQGYIDEGYRLYTGKRHSGDSLSDGDEDLVVSVLSMGEGNPEYVVDEPARVLLYWDAGVVSKKSARNYRIFNELICGGPNEKLGSFIRGLERDRDYAFIEGYVCSDSFIEESLRMLSEGYPNCLHEALLNQKGDDRVDKLRPFCQVVLSSSEGTMLVEAAKKEIGEFASSDPLFLRNERIVCADLFRKNLQTVGYRAKSVDVQQVDATNLEYVCNEGLFEADARLVCSLVGEMIGDNSLSYSNLDDVLFDSEGGVVERIRLHVLENMDVYFDGLVSQLSAPLKDSPSTVVEMLNAVSDASSKMELPVNEESAKGYIRALANKVRDLPRVTNKGLAKLLFELGKCDNRIENICVYILAETEYEEKLEAFISQNGVPEGLSSSVFSEWGIDQFEFLGFCIESGLISDDIFKGIAKALTGAWEEFDVDALDESRVKYVIDLGLVAVNAFNLESVRSSWPGLTVAFAAKDISAYADLVLPVNGRRVPRCEFNPDEVYGLFELDVLHDNADELVLCRLVEGLRDETCLSTRYPDSVCLELLRNDLVPVDSDGYNEVYMQAGKELKNEIADCSAREYEWLEYRTMSLVQAEAIVSRLNEDKAKRFIAKYVREGMDSSRKAAIALCRQAGLEEYADLLFEGHGKVISVTINPADEELFNAFQENELCGKLGDQVSGSGKRKVHGRGKRIVSIP